MRQVLLTILCTLSMSCTALTIKLPDNTEMRYRYFLQDKDFKISPDGTITFGSDSQPAVDVAKATAEGVVTAMLKAGGATVPK